MKKKSNILIIIACMGIIMSLFVLYIKQRSNNFHAVNTFSDTSSYEKEKKILLYQKNLSLK